MCRWLDFVDEGNMTNQLVVLVVVLLLHLHMDNGISYIILHVYYLLAVRTWCLESVCKKNQHAFKMQILSGSKPKGTIPKMTNPKGIRPKEPLPKLVYFCRDLTQCTQSTKQLLRYIHAMISFVHGSFWLVYYAWIGGLLTITGLFKFSNYFHLFTFLVRWSPQRTLVPSFFYLSIYLLSFFKFFHLHVISCDLSS